MVAVHLFAPAIYESHCRYTIIIAFVLAAQCATIAKHVAKAWMGLDHRVRDEDEELVILGLEPRLRLLADALVVRAALAHLIAHAPMLASIRVCGMVRKGRRIADSLRVVQLFEETRREPGIGYVSQARECDCGSE